MYIICTLRPDFTPVVLHIQWSVWYARTWQYKLGIGKQHTRIGSGRGSGRWAKLAFDGDLMLW